MFFQSIEAVWCCLVYTAQHVMVLANRSKVYFYHLIPWYMHVREHYKTIHLPFCQDQCSDNAMTVPSSCFINPLILGKTTEEVYKLVECYQGKMSMQDWTTSLSFDVLTEWLNSKSKDEKGELTYIESRKSDSWKLWSQLDKSEDLNFRFCHVMLKRKDNLFAASTSSYTGTSRCTVWSMIGW